MKHSLTALVALTAACWGFTAQAADADAPADAAKLGKQEAKDLKTQSKGAYEARKHVADANEDLNKADCEVAADGSAEHACKKAARAQKKADKADAKLIHEAEKDAIKQGSSK